jgi:transglutaminase-like putative cysteine protease
VYFEIGHASAYVFSEPICLEPHTIRLRPRSDGSQRLVRYSLTIEPKPAGLAECLDLEGNVVTYAWFDRLTDSLRVSTQSEIETLRENPFDYILSDTAADRLPMEYSDELGLPLAPYRLRYGTDDAVAVFARTIADETERHSLPFLAALNRRIFQMCEVAIREEGDPQPPAATLVEQRGACRDLAVLFVDACRVLGFGARFVSGYQEGGPDQTRRYLHAWAEVYLPGGGWRGYDPTLGLAVADRHVAVAAGMRPGLAAPITGVFRGTGVASHMQADIRIRVSGKALP